MKWAIFHLMLFALFFAAGAKAADSTNVRPPNTIPQQKVAVNVLHYSNSMTMNYASQVFHKCSDGQLPISENFFLKNSTSLDPVGNSQVGYYFFTCRENFFSNDAYYVSLTTNNWRTCQNDTQMQCSIKIEKPPIIRFIVDLPKTSLQNTNTVVWFNQVQLYLGFYTSVPLVATAARGTPYQGTSITYTWAYNDTATPPPVTGNTAISWLLRGGSNTAAWDGGSNRGNWECALSTPNFGDAFFLNITPQLMGKTCTLSCDNNKFKWSNVSRLGGNSFISAESGTVKCQ